MTDSSSKRIVITGVSRGLGRALVHWFARNGHRVIGCARDMDAIRSLNHTPGPDDAFQKVDVTDVRAVKAWVDRILKAGGPPDLLINNAGTIHPNAPFTDIPPAKFDQVIDVNVKGVANVMRAFLPAMIQRGEGVIVNLSSGAGVRGYSEISGYCTSKHAVEGLSKSVAMEIPESMAVVPLQPGVINTDMLKLRYGERASEHDDPETWAERAGPFLLELGPEENGESLRIPPS